MKAPNGVCSLILLIFITISELKIHKVEVDNEEMTIETDFLAELKKELNVPPVTETKIDSAAYDAKDGEEKPFFSLYFLTCSIV